MNLYTIRDNKASASMAPFTAQNHGIAMRFVFNVLTDQPQSDVARYPNDYTLYCLGEFDQVGNLVRGYQEAQHVSDVAAIKEMMK